MWPSYKLRVTEVWSNEGLNWFIQYIIINIVDGLGPIPYSVIPSAHLKTSLQKEGGGREVGLYPLCKPGALRTPSSS